MTKPTPLRLLGIASIAIVAIEIGYWAVEYHVVVGPTVHIRNETNAPAYLELFGRWSDGTDMVSVPPWAGGMCATGTWTWHHHGEPIQVGNGTAAFWSSDSGSINLPPFPKGKPLYVRVDFSGALHLDEPVPDDSPGCASYPIYGGWEWPIDGGGDWTPPEPSFPDWSFPDFDD